MGLRLAIRTFWEEIPKAPVALQVMVAAKEGGEHVFQGLKGPNTSLRIPIRRHLLDFFLSETTPSYAKTPPVTSNDAVKGFLKKNSLIPPGRAGSTESDL